MSLPKIYNWERVRAAMRLLADAFPEDFPNWVLIGGGACWFYREALKNANDPDFRVPDYGAEEETIWLSKDVDFMGLTEAEASKLLQSPFKPETHTISFRGVEVDFLEEGFRLTMDVALRSSREVRASDFIFNVLDPAVLFAEKCALIALKTRPQDKLHHALLVEFLKQEFCADIEKPASLDVRDWLERARTIKTADHDFFLRDNRFVARLHRSIKLLTDREHVRIAHWAKHHLPGCTE